MLHLLLWNCICCYFVGTAELAVLVKSCQHLVLVAAPCSSSSPQCCPPKWGNSLGCHLAAAPGIHVSESFHFSSRVKKHLGLYMQSCAWLQVTAPASCTGDARTGKQAQSSRFLGVSLYAQNFAPAWQDNPEGCPLSFHSLIVGKVINLTLFSSPCKLGCHCGKVF